jgi:hypothetical protein
VSSVKRVVMLVVLSLIAVIGVGAVATPANAFFDLCTIDGAQSSPLPELTEWSPPLASGGGATSIGTPGYGATGYEWFGGGAIPFVSTGSFDASFANPTVNSDCASWLTGNYAKGMGGVYSLMWTMGSAMNQVSLWIYQTAQSTEFLGLLVNNIVNPVFQGVGENDGFIDWYKGALVAVMILAAMWAAVRILQRRSKEAISGLAWHIAFAILGLVLLANPGLLSGVVQVSYKTLSGALASSSDNIAANITGASSQSNLCQLDSSIDYNSSEESGRQMKSIRESTCRMWVSTYLEPWARGQFGTSNPIATDGITEDGAVALDQWNAATQNRDIAIEIPGLERQPEPGSLVALQLSALRVNPREQSWLELQEQNNNQPAWVGMSALRGGEDIEGNYNFGKPGYTYPRAMVSANACPEDGACVVNTGHQNAWQVLTDRAVGHGNPSVASTWAGVSPIASDARFNGTMLMFTGTAVLGGVSAFFSVVMLTYQLLLGVMILFMGFALLGMAIPGVGTQVARDFFARIIEYVIMLTLVTVFLPLTVVLMMYVPDLILPDVGVAQYGFGIGNVLIRNTIALIVGIVMIFAFFRVRKSLRGRQYIKGANARSKWDIGGRITDTTSKAVTSAALVGGVAAAAIVTGGVSAAALVAAGSQTLKGGGGSERAGDGPVEDSSSGAVGGVSPLAAIAGAASSASATQPAGTVLTPSAAAKVYAPNSISSSPVAAGSSGSDARSARVAGAAAAAGFWTSFGQQMVKNVTNFSSKALSGIMSGGGLDAVIHQSRSTLTEMVTGQQVKKIVTDSRGRQSILETGIDRSEAARGVPASGEGSYNPNLGGVDSRAMFEAVYAGVLAADAQRPSGGVASEGVAAQPTSTFAPAERGGGSGSRSGLVCHRCGNPLRECTCK